MAVQIQMRRDTAANWETNDPTLAAGEWGLETDTLKFKIGTGSATWDNLAYSSLPSGSVTTAGGVTITGTITHGADGTGADVRFNSGTAGDYAMWDASEEKLILEGTNSATVLDITDGNVVISDGTLNVSGVITATGGVSGTATEATTVTATANNSTDETTYITFVDGATNAQGIETDTALTYNPSSGVLSATTFTGAATDSTKLAHTGGTLTGVTLAGAVVGADQLISAPIIKDYSETVYAGGNTGSTETLDETNGNVQSWTLDASCTFTMPSGSGLKPGTSLTLILTQDGSSRTGTFTGVKWAGGTAVTLSTGDDDVDILTFTTFNGGASPVWYGFAAGLDMG